LKRELLSSDDEIIGLLSKLAAEGVWGWEAECRSFKRLHTYSEKMCENVWLSLAVMLILDSRDSAPSGASPHSSMFGLSTSAVQYSYRGWLGRLC
jgi:hypothetical protein